MSTVITGLFSTPREAAAAVHSLESQGVEPSKISLVAGESFDKEAFGIDSHTKLAEGVAIGTGTGGAIGAVVAGLTTVGAVVSGGAGLVVAGPLVAALAGAGAGAAGGGILGGLVGLAIPEHEVKHYQDSIEKGSVLVGVECADGDGKERARKTLEQCGAEKTSTA